MTAKEEEKITLSIDAENICHSIVIHDLKA